ncbi:MAG TPA: type II toxin-antitoxin system RelE/ParE family toxin [Elusimicrobiota bacterium]|nr:type II toxin-antitoxin system RelE/ParE family toxin [Elusimicrobiota bacterium]
MRIRYYPKGESGDVQEYLRALRRDPRTMKAAVKLDIDLQTLEEFWPETLNVTVRRLKGWEPLLEIKRRYDRAGYRIFFCVRRDELWLLSAYEKHSEGAPRSELEKAYGRMQLVLGERR